MRLSGSEGLLSLNYYGLFRLFCKIIEFAGSGWTGAAGFCRFSRFGWTGSSWIGWTGSCWTGSSWICWTGSCCCCTTGCTTGSGWTGSC